MTLHMTNQVTMPISAVHLGETLGTGVYLLHFELNPTPCCHQSVRDHRFWPLAQQGTHLQSVAPTHKLMQHTRQRI